MAEQPFAVKLRRMTLEDVEQVFQIDQLSFGLPWSERSFRFEVSENEAARLWVAELETPDGEHRVVGMIVVWLIVDEAHIGTIATHPDYRRCGIGARVLARALLDVQQEGAVMALLEVRRSNTAAQALYERFGFGLDGVRARYYRDNGEDALLISLRDMQRAERMALWEEILRN